MEYIAAFVAFCSLLILGAVIIDCLIDIKNLLKRKD